MRYSSKYLGSFLTCFDRPEYGQRISDGFKIILFDSFHAKKTFRLILFITFSPQITVSYLQCIYTLIITRRSIVVHDTGFLQTVPLSTTGFLIGPKN
jgi:hypothetical protein